MAKEHKPFHPLTRVGGGFLSKIESDVRRAVIAEVKAQPSKGQTLM